MDSESGNEGKRGDAVLKHASGETGKKLVFLLNELTLHQETVLGDSDQNVTALNADITDILHQFGRSLFDNLVVFAVETEVFAEQKHRIQGACGACPQI
jgi:hypothetical protein